MAEEEAETVSQSDADDDGEKQKKKAQENDRCGVIYLSRIPTRMNVKLVREYFQQFGTIGRIYLQPAKEKSGSKERKSHRPTRFREFTEGWVEFTDKKVARRVAKVLNNEVVGGRRRHPWAEEIWNIKYLQSFKWTHLNERMAYEKAVKTKKLRLEVGQAKREAQFFAENLEFSRRLAKTNKEQEKSQSSEDDDEKLGADSEKRKLALLGRKRRWEFHQKQPDEEVRAKNLKRSKQERKNGQNAVAQSNSFLGNIFTAGQ